MLTPGLQQGDGVDVAARAGRLIPAERRIQLIVERKPDARRQHADDRPRAIVHRDGLADDQRIGAIAPPPQPFGQHHHGLQARRRGLLRKKLAAHHRLDAEHRKQLGRDRSAEHALRARGVAAQHEVAQKIRRHAVDGRRCAEVEEIGVGDLGVTPVGIRMLKATGRMHRDQAIGAITERHRAEAEAVDETEDGDVGADAQRERQQRATRNPGFCFNPRQACNRSRRGPLMA
jgi:hypothetical protein